ncbi:MAG TPA: ABC transporter ATP-binding protein [Clostridia bacterium]|nr:ABC transporter ATP-binding protein [Clostridia bacterium]
MSAAVEVIGLKKRFHRNRALVDIVRRQQRSTREVLGGVDLSISEGEVFGLLGPNGAGKTTLIKIICGLVLPDSGTVRVLGLDVVTSARESRRRLGVVYGDERSFFWRLSLRENLRFYAALYGVPRSLQEKRIDSLIRLVDLEAAADQRMHAFSSGMKQRAAIARGLVNDPQVLVLDEPTRSLDPLAAEELHVLIRERVAEGRTVLIATHLMAEAEALCDRLTLLDHGSVVLTGTVGDFHELLGDDVIYRLAVTGWESGLEQSLRLLPGVRDLAIDGIADGHIEMALTLERPGRALPSAIRMIVERGGEIEACTRHEPSLEEMFRTIVRARRNRLLEARSS